jgi:predicted SAM-dependent methyltransferase
LGKTGRVSDLPRRLNLGCGYDRRDGYLNVDADERTKPDLLADVRELAALPDQYFDEILAKDVLEHLPRSDTARALVTWARLLRPGGVLHLRVPSYLDLTERLLTGDYNSPEHHRVTIHLAYGTQAHTGDFHLTCFTPLLLRDYLHEAGFGLATIRVDDGWIFDVTATKGGQDRVDATALHGSRVRFLLRLSSALLRERWHAVRTRLGR